MSTTDRTSQILTALRSGQGTELPALLTAAAKTHYPLSGVDILIVDYNMSAMVAAQGAAAPVPIDGTPEGRVFASQRTAQVESGDQTHRLICALTARGQRLGVLVVTFTDEPDEDVAGEWEIIAQHVAHEIVVVENITDRFRRTRRRRRLTLAAEIQWDTLPARSVATPDFAFAGQLEPAYEVCGDTFDWSTDPEGLTAAVINGYNQGTSAAVLTNFVVAALRNARRSGDDIAAQAALASDLLYTQHQGGQYVDALLLRYDTVTGRLTAVSTGSAQMIRLRGTAIATLDLPTQPALGLEEETDYTASAVPVKPGDRILVVSDGVYDAPNSANLQYRLTALGQVLRRTRLQPAGEAVRTIIRDVLDYRGSPLDDDAVVACLDLLPADSRTPSGG
ncbi:phosphatase [Actinocatenispora thailandica]|uniref:Phosphatase n=1 Tax=Actinocatenispora thailandica TaxID=227318 RepID=A0A7R7HWI2_9ACTN|nr:PP2C family protein-serine/threonine phosphatase [Actinocatenispora thailandica]BCJ34009.1 phosphatase [Actinocatenispora thailandica]